MSITPPSKNGPISISQPSWLEKALSRFVRTVSSASGPTTNAAFMVKTLAHETAPKRS